MARKRVDVTIGAKNKMAAGLKSASRSIKRFSMNVKSAMRGVGVAMRRAALVGVAGFTALIKHGNRFRSEMAQVSTMLNDGSTALPEITKQVRDLSAAFGVAKKTLADGLYDTLSAGIPEGNAIEFLTVATKAAVGGVTDVKTSVDALTTVVNAYGIAAKDAAQVSDVLFKIIKDGKINYTELSENIGKIAPTAQTAGVGLRDLGAMIATLVKVEKPERAMTALRQSMIFAAAQGKTLMQVLNELEGANLTELITAGVPRKSATGIAIMTSNLKVLRKELKAFQNTAGAAEKQFLKMDAVRHWEKAWQSFLLLVTKAGGAIDTVLGPAITRAATWIKNFGNSPAFDAFIGRVADATDRLLNITKLMTTGGPDRTRAVVLMGDIITQSFISGAMQAANILAKGIGAVFDTYKKRYGKELLKNLIPGRFIKKTFDTTRGVFGSGESKPKGDLFDASTPSAKVQDLTSQLDALLKKQSPVSFDVNDIGNIINVMTGKIKPLAEPRPPLGPTRDALALKGLKPLAAGGISAATSMLSTSDLFTMMQTGATAKQNTELGELEKQTTLLSEIRDGVNESGVE